MKVGIVFIEPSVDIALSVRLKIHAFSEMNLSCTLTFLEVSLEVKDQMGVFGSQLESTTTKLTRSTILSVLDRELARPRHCLHSQFLRSL